MLTHSEDEILLKECFEHSGCLRVRHDDPERGRHGGVELRLVASGSTEKREVLKALSRLEVRHGRPYRKTPGTNRWVIPIYSRRDVLAFLKAVRPKGATLMVRKVIESAKRPLQVPRRSSRKK